MENLESNDANSYKDFLTEEDINANYEIASQGQRFVNFLIDNLLMRFGLSYATGFGIGALLGQIAPEFITQVAYNSNSGSVLLFAYIVGVLNYIIYYTLCEKLFKGYTLGKLISGTRAIREDGSELTFNNALLRAVCRLVPFEVFSGFGRPWHDAWTNTVVIKAR